MRVLLFLILVSPAIAAEGPFAKAKIGFTSFGPVKMGMTPAEVRAVAGLMIDEKSPTEGCDYLHVKDDPGISFMISDGRVARVDIEDERHATVSGVRVGDTEKTVKRLYRGRYEQSVHHYIDEGHYFTIRSRDRKHALVIETDGKHVIYIRCGLLPEAEYIERCL